MGRKPSLEIHIPLQPHLLDRGFSCRSTGLLFPAHHPKAITVRISPIPRAAALPNGHVPNSSGRVQPCKMLRIQLPISKRAENTRTRRGGSLLVPPAEPLTWLKESRLTPFSTRNRRISWTSSVSPRATLTATLSLLSCRQEFSHLLLPEGHAKGLWQAA